MCFKAFAMGIHPDAGQMLPGEAMALPGRSI